MSPAIKALAALVAAPAGYLVTWGFAGLAYSCSIYATVESPPLSVGALGGSMLGVASILTALTPWYRETLRERRADRHQRSHEAELTETLNHALTEIARLKHQNALQAQSLQEVQVVSVENRERLNEVADRVRPPLPHLPPGPVEERLSASGDFPVVPEKGGPPP